MASGGPPTITINAGTGGKVKKMTVAAAVEGGVGCEVSGSAPKEGLKTNLGNTKIEINGPSENAEYDDVKLLGLVEGGIDNKLAKTSKAEVQTDDCAAEECYPMVSSPRGICYIFNNKEFEGKEKRTGTDKDRDDMKSAFEKLNFKVKAFDDSEADIMETRLKKLSKEDHSSHDCLAVVFLTHGKEGAVQGTDNEWLSVDTITSYFKSNACPSLVHKPKLFFFQSCRGIKHQKGHKVQADVDGDDEEYIGKEEEELVAPEADFFFGYSTVPGMKALRNVETGGWYIQELARTLNESAHRDDLLGMMTTVKRRLNDRKFELNDGSFLKQTAEMTSRLLKKLYFVPKSAGQ